jgi:hypothetical protein
MREVASVGVGPDGGWDDQTQTEDVGLPEHEDDETSRRAGGTYEEDQPGLAGMGDAGGSDAGLPEHEDDTAGGADTASGEQNP